MSDEKRVSALLWDMRHAASNAVEFAGTYSFEQFLSDLRTRSAIERQVEIVGEAARRLPKAFRDAHEEIPWNAIISQRHVLAHEYDHLREELVYRVATYHAPRLVEQLNDLIAQIEKDEDRR